VRRLSLPLALSLLLIAAFAASASAHGGATAVQAGSVDSGGARFTTLPPKPAKKKAAKRKAAKRRAAPRKRPPASKEPVPTPPAPKPTSDHAFPIRGPFDFGGAGSRFGAGRKGHIHQGQDLSAPEGTPVVAPWDSTVEVVKYQAGGAGYYVVLDGNGEDRDYVFMHLRKGSTLVKVGETVRKGGQIAEVGNTGGSSGAHLHFEIWVAGGWYTGGHPVDPYPFLRAWL
jgi:murein DD-endopeptidase MepM/ murein hydrolase activator NlpD